MVSSSPRYFIWFKAIRHEDGGEFAIVGLDAPNKVNVSASFQFPHQNVDLLPQFLAQTPLGLIR